MVDLRHAFQCRTILHQDAGLKKPRCAQDMGDGNRQTEGAGTGDDEHRDGDGQRLMPVAAGPGHPAQERCKCEHMNGGRIDCRHAVSNAHIGATALLCGVHHLHDIGEERLIGKARGANINCAGEVHGASLDSSTALHADGFAFAGHQRAVDIARSRFDDAVHRQALTSRDAQQHARTDFLQRHIGQFAPCSHHHAALGGHAGEPAHQLAGPATHHVVQRPADEQEEQQRNCRIKIGMFPAIEAFEKRHGRCQQHAEGNRHVHVHPAPRQRLECRAEEGLARIGNGRNGNQGGNEVEQVTGGALCASPYRDRQQHDVGGGKARNSQRAHQGAQFTVVSLVHGLAEGHRRIAKVAQCRDTGGRIGTVRQHGERKIAQAEIDPRRLDARHGGEAALDQRYAGTAMYGWHRHGIKH